MRLLLSAIVCMIFLPVHAQQPARYAIVVDEVFADPDPSMGLPNSSFLELRNLSTDPVNLKGWALHVNNTIARIPTDKILEPDSLLILCSSAAANAYRIFGSVLPMTGFPALPDAGATIVLYTPDHRVMHAFTYDRTDHANALKQEGGWSLEMIDTSVPCLDGGNWTSSIDPLGGTPGRVNSVAGSMEQDGPLHAIRTWAPDSMHVCILFNRTMDSLSATSPGSFVFSDGSIVNKVEIQPPLFRSAWLTLTRPLVRGKTLHLQVRDITDCAGNRMAGVDTLRAGLPVDATTGSVVINELLFDPKPDGIDFVELLNTGDQVVDATTLSLGKRDVQGHVTGIVSCSPEPFLIFPGDHYTMASDPGIIRKTFLVRHPEWQSPPVTLPSMPNDEGDIVLLDRQGSVLEELHYRATWHFPLLRDVEGVSLERIDPHGTTQDPTNWHSAATNVGGGTPTEHNSQQHGQDRTTGEWHVAPEVISPDMDGHDDLLTITYAFQQPGWSISVTVHDRDGRPVRYLCRHLLCGTSGALRWDGLDEQGRHPGHGAYIVVAEGFDLSGNHSVWRKRVSITGTGR